MNVKLLRQVKQHILDGDMSDWSYRQNETSGGPKCGTVGCIAGWAYILGNKFNPEEPDTSDKAWREADQSAIPLLGITDEEADRLFYMSGWPDEFWYEAGEDRALQAQKTAARIDHFIKTEGAE